MNFLKKIDLVLDSSLLFKELISIPKKGAEDQSIIEEEAYLSRRLLPAHKMLLKKWNGLNLDIIRFYGCGSTKEDIGCLRDNQKQLSGEFNNSIVVASDPSGFEYIEDQDGVIYVFDTDGGSFEKVTTTLEELIEDYIFGCNSYKFGGHEWCRELKEHHIL